MTLPQESDKSNNLDLIYTYSESILKAVNDDINVINTKLGVVIAFNGVFIRIVVALPDQTLKIGELSCYSCLIFKMVILLSLITSIWISILGLTTNTLSSVVAPGELIDNWYLTDSETCKLFMLKGLRQAVEGLDEDRLRKSRYLSLSIKIIASAVTLYAIESTLIAIFQVT